MKQNNIENSDTVNDSFGEINLINEVLVSIYRDLFEYYNKKKIYEVAIFLYDNRIKGYMLDNKKLDMKEISSINSLLISRYKDLFDCDYIKIYGLALFLYINGIRRYMFDIEELDIEEIVRYLASRRKCINISNITNNANEVKKVNGDSGQIINMLDYLSVKNNSKKYFRK